MVARCRDQVVVLRQDNVVVIDDTRRRVVQRYASGFRLRGAQSRAGNCWPRYPVLHVQRTVEVSDAFQDELVILVEELLML